MQYLATKYNLFPNLFNSNAINNVNTVSQHFEQYDKSMLGYYLTSYNNLWTDKSLPKEWLHYYNLYTDSSKYKKLVFKASNEEEFIKYLEEKLPHMNKEDFHEMYSKLNENIIPYDEKHIQDLKNKDPDMPNHKYIKGNYFYFAGPSLLIRDSVRMLYVSHDCYVTKYAAVLYIPHQYVLDGGRVVNRKPSSYTDNKLHGECKYNDSPFAKKAMEYSNTLWGNVLEISPPYVCKHYLFSDPKLSSRYGGALPKFGIYNFFNKDYNHMNRDMKDGEKCTDVYNHHTQLITHDEVISKEFTSGGGTYISSPISIYAGCSLDMDSCPITGYKFNKELFYTYGGPPIHHKIYQYLISNKNKIREYFGLKPDDQIVPDKELYDRAHAEYYKKE